MVPVPQQGQGPLLEALNGFWNLSQDPEEKSSYISVMQ